MSLGTGSRKVPGVQVVLNNLYKFTALQMRFPVNAVALVDGTPLTLSLKEFLQKFLEFRCEVVRRRARSVPLVEPLSLFQAFTWAEACVFSGMQARMTVNYISVNEIVLTFTTKSPCHLAPGTTTQSCSLHPVYCSELASL